MPSTTLPSCCGGEGHRGILPGLRRWMAPPGTPRCCSGWRSPSGSPRSRTRRWSRPRRRARSPSARSKSATFRREGEYWTLEFGADTFRVRDAKGMRHLSRLLDSPGRDVHALELARFEAPVSVQRGVVDPSMTDMRGSDDAGPLLDAEAKAAYRERLRELQQELAQAEAWNDPEAQRRRFSRRNPMH